MSWLKGNQIRFTQTLKSSRQNSSQLEVDYLLNALKGELKRKTLFLVYNRSNVQNISTNIESRKIKTFQCLLNKVIKYNVVKYFTEKATKHTQNSFEKWEF